MAFCQNVSGLQRMPYEIMAYIVRELDMEEIFHLSCSGKHFQYLVREENFCKAILLAKAPYARETADVLSEAEHGASFSRAVRRLVKRRKALSQASPYAAGIVGFADSFQYIRGVLCYIIEHRPKRWLRILDFHRRPDQELVVDIPALVSTAVPTSAKSRKYKFRILYHAEGITSCLFSFALPQTENWLLIFEARTQRILQKHLLRSSSRIFVRNDRNYLYFGTHSDVGADGSRKWVINGFDLQAGSWLPQKMHLSNLVGYDIGSTVCFEIIDDYFYGLSNQTDFETEEIDWTSYYYCFRFRLGEQDARNTQVMRRGDGWRRQHSEGPIDDRWGFLALEKDEATGKALIVESRREWLSGRSGSQRTYYSHEIVFPQSGHQSGGAVVRNNVSSAALSEHVDEEEIIDPMGKPESVLQPQGRSPHYVHRGDDSSTTAPIVTWSKTHLCRYWYSSQTFLDLYDGTPSGDVGPRQLRIRAGHRMRKQQQQQQGWGPPTTNQKGADADAAAEEIDERIARLYQENKTHTWPPQPDPAVPHDPSRDAVSLFLNPPGHQGAVTATGDERSIVYATGEDAKGPKALIYIGFDPATKLGGMRRVPRQGVKNPEADCERGPTTFHRQTHEQGTQLHREPLTTQMKGKGKAAADGPIGSIPPVSTALQMEDISEVMLTTASEGHRGWAWVARAMHLDVSQKLTFAYTGP
ncbi:hypothetical protein GGR56DRAFT_660095 [Xylariaceae sp. FL0804]|nr:hypothetical protein GGR56DRAFT_660095 [Xylariaceae sp. FL0804]